MSQTEGAGFRQNCSEYVQMDCKVFFAAADRNKDVILDQLRPYLDTARQGIVTVFLRARIIWMVELGYEDDDHLWDIRYWS